MATPLVVPMVKPAPHGKTVNHANHANRVRVTAQNAAHVQNVAHVLTALLNQAMTTPGVFRPLSIHKQPQTPWVLVCHKMGSHQTQVKTANPRAKNAAVTVMAANGLHGGIDKNGQHQTANKPSTGSHRAMKIRLHRHRCRLPPLRNP